MLTVFVLFNSLGLITIVNIHLNDQTVMSSLLPVDEEEEEELDDLIEAVAMHVVATMEMRRTEVTAMESKEAAQAKRRPYLSLVLPGCGDSPVMTPTADDRRWCLHFE